MAHHGNYLCTENLNPDAMVMKLAKGGKSNGTEMMMTELSLASTPSEARKFLRDDEVRSGRREFVLMSAEHYDWLTAAAKRTYRTVDATQVVIDAVERAEMGPEHAALARSSRS